MLLLACFLSAPHAWQLSPTPHSRCAAMSPLATAAAGDARQCARMAIAERDTSTSTEHATALINALELAVADRRRVDELVTLFEYNAKVEAAGAEYVGQGAVKRFSRRC